MDQSWRRARLRAIRRQLFGASAFHRDSNVDTYPTWLAYAQAIQVYGIYFTFRHVSLVKHNTRLRFTRNTVPGIKQSRKCVSCAKRKTSVIAVNKIHFLQLQYYHTPLDI